MLRVKHKMREVLDPTTNKLVWRQYPPTREAAQLEKIAKYYPFRYVCPVHGANDPARPNESSVFFTITGQAACCARHAAAAEYSAAVAQGEPASIHDATTRGLSYYWASPQVIEYCGHPSKLTLAGRCAFCEAQRVESPRQLALAAGAIWYTPESDDPCLRGHIAPRRVSSGSCQQCEDADKAARQAQRIVAEQPIYEAAPDLILARDTARALGYAHYRTGEACKYGHTGWRYVSTGGCMDCLKGR